MSVGTISMRRLLVIAIPAVIMQLAIFKVFYPFASFFFTDSFGYVYAAAGNLDVHIWPVGYSKFLRVFNTFFHSDTALVCFQYLLLQACGLYFFFTLFRLLRPSKAVSIILFVFLVFNPLFLYLANSVSSDALFIGLSLLWISQLLWIIRYPSRRRLLVHAILLACLFTIRYTAIYYPLVAGMAIFLSTHTWREKLIAISLPMLLIIGFVYYTANATREASGIRKFSPFSGWQLANNALYMYPHLGTEPGVSGRLPVPLRELDNTIRRYFDTVKKEQTLFDPTYPGIYYLWSQQSPLAVYREQQHRKYGGGDYFKVWASVSPLYEDYGAWWIRHYPLSYIRYFCLPNTARFALPPLEFMEQYNSGMDTVDRFSRGWFHYKDQRVWAFSRDVQSSILAPFPPISLIFNLFFLGVLAIFLTTKGIFRAMPVFSRQLSLMVVLWILHFGFSIFAAPVVLRYQVFSLLCCCSFSLLLVERLLSWEKTNKEIKTKSDEQEKNNRRGLRLFPGLSIRLRRQRKALRVPDVQGSIGVVSLDPSYGGSDRVGNTSS